MKNNEVIETPEVIDEDIIDITDLEVYDESEKSGSGLGKIALVTALVAGGIGFLCYKFRGKIEEKRVEKLRKKGYTIIEPEIDEIVEDLEVEEDEIVDAESKEK